MLYDDVLTYVVAALVLVGAVVRYWWLEPRRRGLPPNRETDAELRPPSNRTRQDFYFDVRRPSRSSPQERYEEAERQALLSRVEQDD